MTDDGMSANSDLRTTRQSPQEQQGKRHRLQHKQDGHRIRSLEKEGMSDKQINAIRFEQYDIAKEDIYLDQIRDLMEKELSEPYSIYVYHYFLRNWPKLCFMAVDEGTAKLRGVIVCKLEPHQKHRERAERGYIAMLATEEKYRGRGIATQLVKKAIEEMNVLRAEEVVLETEVTNNASLKLYGRLGFLRTKRLHRYYLNGNHAFRLMLLLDRSNDHIPKPTRTPQFRMDCGLTKDVFHELDKAWQQKRHFPAAVAMVVFYYSWIDCLVRNCGIGSIANFDVSDICPGLDDNTMRNEQTWYDSSRPLKNQKEDFLEVAKAKWDRLKVFYEVFASCQYEYELPTPKDGSDLNTIFQLYVDAFIVLIEGFLTPLDRVRRDAFRTKEPAKRYDVTYAAVLEAILNAEKKAERTDKERKRKREVEKKRKERQRNKEEVRKAEEDAKGAAEESARAKEEADRAKKAAERVKDEAESKAFRTAALMFERAEKGAQRAEEKSNLAKREVLQPPPQDLDGKSSVFTGTAANEKVAGGEKPPSQAPTDGVRNGDTSKGADSLFDRVSTKTDQGPVIPTAEEDSDPAVPPRFSDDVPEKKSVPPPASENLSPCSRSEGTPIFSAVSLQHAVDAKVDSKDFGRADSLRPREYDNIISSPDARPSATTPDPQPASEDSFGFEGAREVGVPDHVVDTSSLPDTISPLAADPLTVTLDVQTAGELPSNAVLRSPPIGPPNLYVVTAPPLENVPSQGSPENGDRHQGSHDPATLDRNVTNTDPNECPLPSNAWKRAASTPLAAPVPEPDIAYGSTPATTADAPPRGPLRDVLLGGYYLHTPLPYSAPLTPQNNAAPQLNPPPQPSFPPRNWPSSIPLSAQDSVLRRIHDPISHERSFDYVWGIYTTRVFRYPGNPRWETYDMSPWPWRKTGWGKFY